MAPSPSATPIVSAGTVPRQAEAVEGRGTGTQEGGLRRGNNTIDTLMFGLTATSRTQRV